MPFLYCIMSFETTFTFILYYSKLPPPPRTGVFAFVTEPWRLSSLSTGATPPPRVPGFFFFDESPGYRDLFFWKKIPVPGIFSHMPSPH